MGLLLNKDLPVKNILKDKINFLAKNTKCHLKIGILNLMPVLEDTEKDLLTVLNDPILNIEIDFVYLTTKENEPEKLKYLKKYYKSFSSIKKEYYDGFIVTGAPLEHINYLDIYFIEELKEFFKYTKTHVKSTIFLCWASEFGLQYFYDVNRYKLNDKASGLYLHYTLESTKLTKGFDDYFWAPISRYCSIIESDILRKNDLLYVSKSNETGAFIIESKDGSKIFITGHLEYNLYTLDMEYQRDLKKGLDINMPLNYYKENNQFNKPIYKWQAHATLLYHNWLHYYLYKPFK